MVTIEKKALKAGNFVNTSHVDAVVRNYKQERWVHNSKRLGKEDSLSVWYSVEELEEFLATVKQEGGDGIRMYFGAYGHDYSGNPLYAGRQTIVMVATRRKDTPTGEADKDLYITTEKGNTVLAYNIGRLCPPTCTQQGGGQGEDLGVLLVDKGDEGMVIV